MYHRQWTLGLIAVLGKLRFLGKLAFEFRYCRKPKLTGSLVVPVTLGNLELVLRLFEAQLVILNAIETGSLCACTCSY